MATFNEKYENLPGVKVAYEDGNLFSGANTGEARTQSILLIGSAIDGPVGTPVSVNQLGGPKEAAKIFGGMMKKEKRDGIATLAEYKAPYNTVELVAGQHTIILEKPASEGNPVIKESVIISHNNTALVRVNDTASLTVGTFYVDAAAGTVQFSQSYSDLEVTYDVLKSRVVKVPHQGNLIRAMYEAIEAGAEDIRLLRIDGKRAKTELAAKDPAQELIEDLGLAAGNNKWNSTIPMPTPASTNEEYKLNTSSTNPLAPITYVTEHKQDGTMKTWSGVDVKNTVLNVDATSGSETIYFKDNVFRPGNSIEIGYEYIKRTYTNVLHSDTDGQLSNVAGTSTWESPHAFWSQNPSHIFELVVKDSAGTQHTVPQTDSGGTTYYWTFGTDKTVETVIPDETGAISLTDNYDTWASAYGAPIQADIASAHMTYWYYTDSAPISDTNANDHDGDGNPDYYVAPGSTQIFSLGYNPTGADFRIFFEDGSGTGFDLVETTTDVDGDYTLDFSGDTPKVAVEAGAVPLIGATIKAQYKTADNMTVESPKLLVEGRYGGSVYGRVTNPYTEEVAGVEVEVSKDPEDANFLQFVVYKPEEKRLSTNDTKLVYRFKNMEAVQTLGDLASYINADPLNNVVRLTAAGHASVVSVKGLFETNGPVFLGQYLNPTTDMWELKKDEAKAVTDPARFPWMGTDGFFDTTDLKKMEELYKKLGGEYAQAPDGEYVLVNQGIYNKIENYAVDIIVLLEAYSNTKIGREQVNSFSGELEVVIDHRLSFATQLAQHCAIVTAKTWECISVIGVAPAKSTDLFVVDQYIQDLTIPGANDHFMYEEGSKNLVLDDDGNQMDIGRYVNVVFGPELGMVNGEIGGYVSNGVSLYAGLISGLNPEISTTNKRVAAQGARYTLSESQLNRLSGGRYVAFEQKVTNNQGGRRIVVKDGVTAAGLKSDYQRLSTVRITHATVQLIRRKADPFIGMPNGLAQRNSLATEIQAGLDRLKELGVLQQFQFSIYTSAREKVLGNAFINLELVPQFEMRKVYTSVSLRASL